MEIYFFMAAVVFQFLRFFTEKVSLEEVSLVGFQALSLGFVGRICGQ